jgi:hypothetical protein
MPWWHQWRQNCGGLLGFGIELRREIFGVFGLGGAVILWNDGTDLGIAFCCDGDSVIRDVLSLD